MKLYVLGASGTGVTTLGHRLAEKCNIPYFDSDSFFWKPSEPPFTIRRQPTIRNEMAKSVLGRHEHFIFGGSAINWGDEVFPVFTGVVFLYVPQAIRLERLRKREWERYGHLIETDAKRKKQYTDFIAWAADYDTDTGIATRTLNAHEAWLKTVKVPLLKIEGDTTVEERIERVENFIRDSC